MDQSEPDVTILSRQALYEKMWQTPGSKLAKEFGLSDVGLAKVCDRHEVPRPPRGYWAKLAHGKRVQQPPLPQLDDQALDEIRIFRNGFFGHDDGLSGELPKRSKLRVPETLVAPHSLIATSRSYLRSAKRGDDGLLRPDCKICLNIRVAPTSLERALLIFDTFLKEWERLGGKATLGMIDLNNSPVTTVELHGDSVPVELFEETKRVATENKTNDYWTLRNAKREPTGKLVLQVGGGGWVPNRRRWANGKRQNLESLLDSFIGGLLEILECNRLDRLDEECANRQRAKVQEVRESAKRLKEAEEQRKENLAKQVSAWREANDIRDFLAEMRRKVNAAELAPIDPDAFAEWMDWAAWHAEHIDPLSRAPERPEFVRVPKNTPIDQLDLTRRTRPIVQQMGITDTNDLYAVKKDQVLKLHCQWQWGAWDEICRVLEGLGYDVTGRHYW